jgi:hypothetical protein
MAEPLYTDTHGTSHTLKRRKRSVVSFFLLWTLLVVFFGVSYFFSSISVFPSWIDDLPVGDIALHLAEFALLALIFCIVLHRTTKTSLLTVMLLSLVVICIWAFLDEYHQSFIPGRHSKLSESVIDILGGVIGIILWIAGVFFWRQMKKSQCNHV